jgi:hypothetical protein
VASACVAVSRPAPPPVSGVLRRRLRWGSAAAGPPAMRIASARRLPTCRGHRCPPSRIHSNSLVVNRSGAPSLALMGAPDTTAASATRRPAGRVSGIPDRTAIVREKCSTWNPNGRRGGMPPAGPGMDIPSGHFPDRWRSVPSLPDPSHLVTRCGSAGRAPPGPARGAGLRQRMGRTCGGRAMASDSRAASADRTSGSGAGRPRLPAPVAGRNRGHEPRGAQCQQRQIHRPGGA